MKKVNFVVFSLLIAAFCFCSCSKDDEAPVVLLQKNIMEGKYLYPSVDSFIWNGEINKTPVSVQFKPYQEDTTKMQMVISGLVPAFYENDDEDMNVIVDVIPKSDKILFQGTMQSYSNFTLSVEGFYAPSSSEKGYELKLDCQYQVIRKYFLDSAFTYYWQTGFAGVSQSAGGGANIDGVPYSGMELGDAVMKGMNKVFAQSALGLYCTFDEQGGFELKELGKKNSNEKLTSLVSGKYWFTNYGDICLEFSEDMAKAYMAYFFKVNENLTDFFDASGDRYFLGLYPWTSDTPTVRLNYPFSARAFKLFAKERGDECSDLLKKQLRALNDILSVRENNPKDWWFVYQFNIIGK